jgi:hypothetical protein
LMGPGLSSLALLALSDANWLNRKHGAIRTSNNSLLYIQQFKTAITAKGRQSLDIYIANLHRFSSQNLLSLDLQGYYHRRGGTACPSSLLSKPLAERPLHSLLTLSLATPGNCEARRRLEP